MLKTKQFDILKELNNYNNKNEHKSANVHLHVFDYFDD